MLIKTLKLTGAPEPTENEIQTSLIRRLVARGYIVLRVNGGGFKDKNGRFVKTYNIAGLDACSGFPDVIGLRSDGPARLFEVKRRGGKCSPAQERFASFADAHDIQVEVVESIAVLDALEL